MKALFLSQVFYPDVEAVAQYTCDLARDLAAAGHDVTVLSSRRGYHDPSRVYSAEERWNGVNIVRVLGTGLGKKALWRRAVDFGSVTLRYLIRLLFMPRQDVVIALTAPPLVSVLGALFTRMRGGRLVLWVMDLNPDQAIAAGVLRPGSMIARVLEGALRFSLRNAAAVVVLDRFMRDRLIAKGVPAARLFIAPPWAQESSLAWDAEGREVFRRTHGVAGKFVVMYSGNHSPCHPLATLLEGARRLSDREDIVFLFVGGGSEHDAIASFARQHGLSNVICLPYQPFSELSASLSAADLHAVVLGDAFVGIVHPSKIYNVLQVGVPFLYVGPSPSHVTDLTPACAEGDWAFHVAHGDVDKLVAHITSCAKRGLRRAPDELDLAAQFSESIIVSSLLRTIEAAGTTDRGAPVAALAPDA